MTNKSQITIAVIAVLAILSAAILIFYKSSSRGEEVKNVISNSSAILSSQANRSAINSSMIGSIDSSLIKNMNISSLIISSRLEIKPQLVETKSTNFRCELNPDGYMDIIDLDNDCFGFSSRIMCDFDNNESAIKQLKPQLYDLAQELYDQHRSKILDKHFFVNMTCPYIDDNYFEFGLVIPDNEYHRVKTGEFPHAATARFVNQYSATKVGNNWSVEFMKDRSFDFDNPPIREIIQTPECQFPQQGNFRFQRIVQTEYGCYDFTIDPSSIDLSSKFQDDYFTFSLYDLETLSRGFYIENFKKFGNQKAYIVAKDFKFTDEIKLEFKLDLAASPAEANQKTNYQKTFTLFKKKNNLWFQSK